MKTSCEMNKNVLFDENSMGITQESLKRLRDILLSKSAHRIRIVEAPTGEMLAGFFIYDYDLDEWSFTGDGFRTDNGGEGGAGYNTAKVLLMGLGIWSHVDFEPNWVFPLNMLYSKEAIQQALNRYVGDRLDWVGQEIPFRIIETKPEYIRGQIR